MPTEQLQFLPAFAELLDRLAIDQIKETAFPDEKTAVADEMARLHHDIDTIIEQRSLKLSAKIIGLITALAQLNLHIWKLKDRMEAGEGDYVEQLKLAHQLNGVRNQIKNRLLEECGDKEKSAKRTNYNTDGLKGWELFILPRD